MSVNLLSLNSSRTECLLIGRKKQLGKIHNSSLNTTHSAQNLGFIFDEHLTFSDQIVAISKDCYYHTRHLRCTRPYRDSTTACTIAISIVYPKLDYCYSLTCASEYPPKADSELSCPCCFKAPKSRHITPILRCLHWLKVTESIEYKLPSFTYKFLTNAQTPYLHNLISVQPPRTLHSPFISHHRRSTTNIILRYGINFL